MYGNFLREMRVSRNLTQQQLSEIVGIAPSNLSAYENNRQQPSFEIVNKLVNACGYRLLIDAEPGSMKIPLAKGGWTPCEQWPDRLPEDPSPPYEGLTIDTPPRDRASVIQRVVVGNFFKDAPLNA